MDGIEQQPGTEAVAPPPDGAAAGGDAGTAAAPQEPPLAPPPPKQERQEEAPPASAQEPNGGMMLAADDGGLVGASGQRISAAEIQLVQNLVERCLQCYMNMREVVAILQQQAKIEPDFTALVWQKLEEQNAEFFSAYYTRLRLKDQILAFNNLLEQHALLGQKLGVRPGGPGAARGRGMDAAPPTGGKVSTSGLFLDRSGAFHAAGDYLIDTGAGAGGGAMPMAAMGASLGHPHDGGAGAGGGLGHLPRSFSLSDLSVELTAQMAEGDVHMALMGGLNFAGDAGMGRMGAGGAAGAGEGMGGKLPHSFSLSDMTLFNEPRMQA